MAELTTQTGRTHKRGVRRSKKSSTRVDLTPMVDLGFLLITFFILTTTWSKPHASNLNMPAKGDSSNISRDAALTIVALSDNRVFYYHGSLEQALKEGRFGITGYGLTGGIGDVIREKQIAMDLRSSRMDHALSEKMTHDHSTSDVRPSAGELRSPGRGRKEMMLLIKPSPEASYKNVVNLLDETLINRIGRYALEDLSPEEQAELDQVRQKLSSVPR